MSSANEDLIRRWFEEVWNKGNMEAIDEMSAPHAVGRGQAQHGVEIHGTQSFKPFARMLRSAFPDIHIEIEDTFSAGDKVVARWSATMTHRGEFMGIVATGKTARVTGISIQQIQDGRIVRAWDNWDQLALLVQIGKVMPADFMAWEAR